MSFFDLFFLNNSIRAWFMAFALSIVIILALLLVKRSFLSRLFAFTQKTETAYDDLVIKMLMETKLFLIIIVAFYFGSLLLTIPDGVQSWLSRVAILAVLIQIGIWGNTFITNAIQQYQTENLKKDAGQVTTFRALSFVAKLILFSVILLLALDNLGVEITTLLTGLGVGSVAVALAVQNILADLFAALSIAIDQPFVIGDFIIVDEYLGTVEKLGLKTTRLRSLSGEQLIFSNTDLLNSRIRNYKRMGERRVEFSFGVIYQTPAEKIRALPDVIREIIEKYELARFDRAHFKEFGESSLQFEVVYFILSADYNQYMDLQQNINLGLFEKFEQEGIEFAYPTQTIFVGKES